MKKNDRRERTKIPRDRHGSLEPQIVTKHQTRWAGFDDKILSLYARGMKVREILSNLQDKLIGIKGAGTGKVGTLSGFIEEHFPTVVDSCGRHPPGGQEWDPICHHSRPQPFARSDPQTRTDKRNADHPIEMPRRRNDFLAENQKSE